MLSAKLWLKNRLERCSLLPPFVRSEVVKRTSSPASARVLQILIPHRLNWKLTTATVRAFQRLTTGAFGITVIVNFDEIPADWDGWRHENLTVVKNSVTLPGRLYRKIFAGSNGSMENAFALHTGILAEPLCEWAFVAHSDSAPLRRGWNEEFSRALEGGLICGNVRDTTRVLAAHASGTYFNQQEFLRRGGSVWPHFRFGNMVWDVGDGITLALHEGKAPVPVLPNNRQNPELNSQLGATSETLAKFAANGSNVSFDLDRRNPIFAHLGRGTPRSQQDPFFSEKLPMDLWIDWIETIGKNPTL